MDQTTWKTKNCNSLVGGSMAENCPGKLSYARKYSVQGLNIAFVLKTYIFLVILIYLIIELGTCEDGIENELEEGTDCGGPDCPACGEFPVRSGSAKN